MISVLWHFVWIPHVPNVVHIESNIFCQKTVHFDCTDESDGVCCIFHVLLLRRVWCDVHCLFVVDCFDFCCEPVLYFLKRGNIVVVISNYTFSSRLVINVCNLWCVHPVVMHLNGVMLVCGASEWQVICGVLLYTGFGCHCSSLHWQLLEIPVTSCCVLSQVCIPDKNESRAGL